MKVLIIDNHDSFTYNLYHYLVEMADHVEVWRNDAFSLTDVNAFDRIVLSPGPGLPSEAGNTLAVLDAFSSQKPILGVCLGLQAIVEHCGGTLLNLPEVLHGRAGQCFAETPVDALFQNIPSPFQIGHYHSWVAHTETLPAGLRVTARDAHGHIMAVRHNEWPLCGVQFHPESVLTPQGKQMLRNWITS